MKNAAKFAILLTLFITLASLPLFLRLIAGDKGSAAGRKSDAIHSIKDYAARNELALQMIGEGGAPADDEEDEADSGLELMREGVLKVFRSVGILDEAKPKETPKKDPKIARVNR